MLLRRSNTRSKPTLERVRGLKSKVLIATSSIEQHGYEQARRTSPAPAPNPSGAFGAGRFGLTPFNFKRAMSIFLSLGWRRFLMRKSAAGCDRAFVTFCGDVRLTHIIVPAMFAYPRSLRASPGDVRSAERGGGARICGS